MADAPDDKALRLQRRFLEIRGRGRAHYVWYFGVFRFGGLWTVGMTAFAYVFLGHDSYPPLIGLTVPPPLGWFLYIAPFGVLAGFLFGRRMWKVFERNTRHLGAETTQGSGPPN